MFLYTYIYLYAYLMCIEITVKYVYSMYMCECGSVCVCACVFLYVRALVDVCDCAHTYSIVYSCKLNGLKLYNAHGIFRMESNHLGPPSQSHQYLFNAFEEGDKCSKPLEVGFPTRSFQSKNSISQVVTGMFIIVLKSIELAAQGWSKS